MNLAIIQCPICSSEKIVFAAQLCSEIDGQHYSAHRCRGCKVTFCDPMPQLSYQEIQTFYDGEYTMDLRANEAEEADKSALKEATRKQMEIVEKFISPGNALNIGAMSSASGVLLERGWKLKVLEPSQFAARTAFEKWGYDIEVAMIEETSLASESFDFIKMGHVIEHLTNPEKALNNCTRMLRNGGVLIDTDNAGGIKTRIEILVRWLLGERCSVRLVRKLTGKNLAKRYGMLTPPIHLYTFSEKSLTILLQKTGFQILRVFKPSWGDPTWYPLEHTNSYSPLERISLRIDRLGAKLGMGEIIAVLAMKK